MKYLKIQNKGELDIRLVALMGGTTKANDEFKIGQFGTGLKYTLAYLFRNNLSFKIFVGNEEVKITTEIEVIRDEEFEIICINGNRTSITTKMGEDWSAWMIVRELWCNALDEGDASKETTTDLVGAEGYTTFYIQVDSEIRTVVLNWNNYFIHEQEPISSTHSYDIYKGGESLRLYKNGVLIHENDKFPSLFSYDIKNATINELREYKGTASFDIVRALSGANSKAIRYFLENITEDVFEGKMDYNWFTHFGKQWKETLGEAKIIHPKAIENIQARGLDIDTASSIVVPQKVYDFLTKEFEGIGALRVADKVNEFYETYNPNLELRIKEALAVLDACDYTFHPELTFTYGVFGDKTINAKVDLDAREVFISESMLDKSLFDVVSILVEENEHFKTGFSDETRAFQQHFINLFTKTLLDKNEVRL